VTVVGERTPRSTHMTETDLLRELEPVVEENLERHLKVAKEWMPHEYVPWSEGRDFDGVLGGEAWAPDQSKMSDVARTSLIVNLLTEDNLPSYHREIHRMFGRGDGPWINWVNRWTAEEGRHAIVLRDYLVVTRNIDPYALERSRMNQLQIAYDHDDGGNVLRGLAYVAFQELATRISHRNTGRYSADPVADRIMARIAADENLHMVFYRDMLSEAMQIDPSAAVHAIADEVIGFQMPGAGMESFTRKAAQMAKAGIYDLRVHHDDVVWPLLTHWGVFELTNLDPSAEIRRDELRRFLVDLDAQASRFEAKRALSLEREAARAG
jgi:acyl-[acyl-carrier-protein] desaturase